MVHVLLDSKEFKQKPKGGEIGQLNQRMVKYPVSLPIEQLALEINKGKSFVPAHFKSVNGTTKRTKEYWQSQEVVALDFDDGMTLDAALNEPFFKENAAFLYTTFSHTEHHHKFRVVFVLSKVITNYQEVESIIQNLMQMYPQADKACKDGTRLFFGGKEVFEFDYANQLNAIDFINSTLRGDIQGSSSNTSPRSLPNNAAKGSIVGDGKYAENIDLIKNKEIDKLQAILNVESISLYASEVDDYLKRQDMRKLLGIQTSGSFYDIFHDEGSPSSSIFLSNEKNGHQLYKCHSESHLYVGNIFDVVKSLLGTQSIQQAREFLVELYQIGILLKPKDEKLLKRLKQFKKVFDSEQAKKMYPNMFRVLEKHKLTLDIQVLFSVAIEYIGNFEGRAIIYVSTNRLAKMLHKSNSIVGRNINTLTLFKLIKKLRSDEIPKSLYRKLNKRKRQNNYSYMSSVYEIPQYSEDLFNEIEAMCKKWLENGCTSKTMCYEGVLRTFGEETAKRVFPQIKEEKLGRLSDEVTMQIHKVTMEKLNDKGWATEKEILEAVKLYFKGQKAFKQAQFKRCVSEMLDMYDLELIATNKVIKAEMNITELDMKNTSFPKIIRQKSFVEVRVNNIDLLLTQNNVEIFTQPHEYTSGYELRLQGNDLF